MDLGFCLNFSFGEVEHRVLASTSEVRLTLLVSCVSFIVRTRSSRLDGVREVDVMNLTFVGPVRASIRWSP